MARPFAEQTMLVTGATQGIGNETARALARLGPRLLVTARDPARGARVVDELRAESGNAKVELALVDFASFASVRAFLEDVNRRVDALDVLVNNAGAFFSNRRDTIDGYEMTFQVNHLGYFMTTLGLFDKLRAAGDARVVCVSSDAHFAGSVDFAQLGRVSGWFGYKAYGASKLMNILFTREGARRFPKTVTINALHPGMVSSGFGLNDGGAIKAWYKMMAPVMKTPAEGADTSVWLATSPAVHGVTGQYFSKRKETAALPVTRDPVVARRLWEESERMTGLRLPPSPGAM